MRSSRSSDPLFQMRQAKNVVPHSRVHMTFIRTIHHEFHLIPRYVPKFYSLKFSSIVDRSLYDQLASGQNFNEIKFGNLSWNLMSFDLDHHHMGPQWIPHFWAQSGTEDPDSSSRRYITVIRHFFRVG